MRKIMLVMSVICLTAFAAGCEENGMLVLMGEGTGEAASGDACGNCGLDQTCVNGKCIDKSIEDPCAKCGSDKICVNGECVECRNDDKKCENNNLFVCINKKWEEKIKICGINSEENGNNKYVSYSCDNGRMDNYKCKDSEVCAYNNDKVMCNGDLAYNEGSVCENENYQKCSFDGKKILKCSKERNDGKYKYMEDKVCNDGEFCQVKITGNGNNIRYSFSCAAY